MESEDNAIGEYLRARRELITPEQVGIPAGAGRRVAGLRREEVAMLAGLSADYYVRLERGKGRHPSAQVLSSLARVLQLDVTEEQHLLSMIAPRPQTAKRRPRLVERVPDRLHRLISALPIPAFIEGRWSDVLGANSLATALSPRLVEGHNRLRSFFLDPAEQDFHHDWSAWRRMPSQGCDNPSAPRPTILAPSNWLVSCRSAARSSAGSGAAMT